jgi:hypothetical protein
METSTYESLFNFEKQTYWVLEISLRDAQKGYNAIIDIPTSRRQEMEWVHTDTATIWSEDLSEEIKYILDAQGVEYTLTELN